ncbi:MAG: tripartite tricarboxylate transporter substrate binding protein [Betaproteobacteria bacterium]|nr:tripartite tricarboxylate transporter substrate binding protein [Betaproteobacteria bacterium]
MSFRLRSAFALMVAAMLPFSLAAHAQPYPAKPVRIIISFPPGGITDVLARHLAQKMQDGLGQSFLVDNRPGGNFIIAAEAAAKAAPDGYTLFMVVDSTFTLNPLQNAKLPYDPVRDFSPISLVALQSLFVVASTKAPGNSFKEVLAYARANPGKVTFGSSAPVAQLIGEQIKVSTGVNMLHVPFKGSPPMLQALLSGDIDFAITTFVPYANYVKDGKLRGLAVTGTGREAPSPDSPTLAELGFPELGYRLWFGLVAPAGTPKPILDKLHAETGRILNDPDSRQRLIAVGLDPAPSTPEQLGAMIKGDLDKWGRVIKAAGIKMGN